MAVQIGEGIIQRTALADGLGAQIAELVGGGDTDLMGLPVGGQGHGGLSAAEGDNAAGTVNGDSDGGHAAAAVGGGDGQSGTADRGGQGRRRGVLHLAGGGHNLIHIDGTHYGGGFFSSGDSQAGNGRGPGGDGRRDILPAGKVQLGHPQG